MWELTSRFARRSAAFACCLHRVFCACIEGHAAAGEWVHLFPEGKVNQSGKLGADGWGVRSEDESERVGGRLKWGVGKIIGWRWCG